MSIKFHCPHCEKTLVAEDQTAGRRKACPACGRAFTVPDIGHEPPPAMTPLPTCPNCKAELAPNATACHLCHTDLSTGKRPPWHRRLAQRGLVFWTLTSTGIAAIIIAVVLGIELYRIKTQPPRVAPPQPATLPALDVEGLATALLGATDGAARAAALANLRGVEARVADTLAEALRAAAPRAARDLQVARNCVAAIEILTRQATVQPDAAARWREPLTECQGAAPLREAALVGRGLLDDARVAPDLVSLWLQRLDRQLFFERLSADLPDLHSPGLSAVLQAARRDLADAGDAVRHIGQDAEADVYDPLVGHYWESWTWLGQARGSAFADAVFVLARPGDASFRFDPNDVRGPRDLLARITTRATPDTRAAAAMILVAKAPQYQSLRERVAGTLADLLDATEPAGQQRLTLAITELRGRTLDARTPRHPLDVTAAHVAAAADRPLATGRRDYPTPPDLVYEAVTRHRLLERDLLPALQADWPRANAALAEWLRRGIGYTPRLDPLLDPGQRAPHYPALAAALTMAGVSGPPSLRPRLELWSEAREQPGWVRGLALTALARLAVAERRPTYWPQAVELPDAGELAEESPGLWHYACIIAAGGPDLRARLQEHPLTNWPSAMKAQLVRAVQRLESP